MYVLDALKEALAADINALLGKTAVSAADFVTPPDPKLGDLSLACFAAAKVTGDNPAALASRLATEIKNTQIAAASSAGPYFNVVISSAATEAILREIKADPESYGASDMGGGKRVMLEYANGNTHKEVHVGHLRNIAYGDAVNRVLAAAGFTSIPVAYINDFGIHVAKTLWHYQKTKAVAPEDNRGFFLGKTYTAAVQAMGEDADAKREVGDVMKAIESRTGETYELWQTTRQWSLDQWARTNEELDIQMVETFYESDYIEKGLAMVEEFKKKGLLIESQGAIIANLEDYKLGVLVVIRSDGTALYPVADFALTFHKVEAYKLDTSLWVVDTRQGQYLHQLFKVLELAGLKAHLAHLPYDFVTLPSGMMSSRTGNVITYEELKQTAIARTREETRKRHEDWSDEKVESIARTIAFAALKFEMVKVGGDKVITFDIDQSLRFDGYTAAYLQYTYARIMSMKRKAPASVAGAEPNLAALAEARDRRLALQLGLFPRFVEKAAASYQPSEIAKYLFELGQLFNDYYHAMPILNDATLAPEIAAARLQLAESVALVIKRGLGLLGIETVEEM